MKLATLTFASALAALVGQAALAAEIEVKMLNKGAEGAMVFEPAFVKAQVGDTVHFVAADKGHNAETVPGMLPDGATPLAGKISEDVTLTLDRDGVWGIRCKPHYGLGMVALIVAGDPVNLEAAKAAKNPGKAKKHFDELFEELEGH
jgi:pseudoazurin